MDDLLKEAIADAKAVRETALENAKMALEEAFTPKLKSMLAQKIQQEIEDEGEGHDEDGIEEVEDDGEGHDDGIEEVEDEGEDKVDEISMEDEEGEDEKVAEIEDEVEDEGYSTEEEEEEPSGIEDEGEDHDSEDEMGEDLDLEAILAELEEDLNEEEEEDEPKESVETEEIEENDVSSEIGKSDNKVADKANDSSETGAQGPEGEGKDEPAGSELDDHTVVKEGEEEDDDKDGVDEDIDLEEVLKALSEEEDEDGDKESHDENAKLQAEIKEHRDVVKYLRGKLNEVNLLNAKLLFSNKLFRAFGLSNEQKLKVVETFDRTKNLREIKLVYSTLAESFSNVSVKPIQESKGSSSKPVASTKPANEEVLTEGVELKNRFKKLANIL